MEFVSSAATETGIYLLPKIKKHFGYFFKYKNNMETLKLARDKLDAKRNDASLFKDQTDRKFQDVGSSTDGWGTGADQLHQKAQKIISRDNVSCLNLCSRYSLSKHASELTLEINEMVKTAPDFGTAFDRPTPELGPTFNQQGFVEFDSRLKILDGVYEALKDEEVSMCSICGMGGIGKTTLVKKLIQKVEADHRLFDKVAMVTVSQNPNLEKIQSDIFEQLGLKIDETGMTSRRKKLHAWLKNNRTLLVLDDVWWELNNEDFENVGIPLMSKECKIVITSRNEDECKKMGSQKCFHVKFLEEEEAWGLFRQYARECVEDLDLKEMAKKIADECDGLPIAIVTIAAALKEKPTGVWNDSLRKLQKSNLQGISDMEKVYSRIQLSYDLLKDDHEEARSIFRLCCLYPEDFNVPVEDLVMYGKGLELFKDVDTMAEARDRVELIIYKLKKSFLLLDGKNDGFVRMHDIVRDFAISICTKDKHPYLLTHGNEMVKWPDQTSQYENCSVISFKFGTIKEHPVELSCPKLNLLRLSFGDGSSDLPIGIFKGMKELRVLDLNVPNLLQPLTMPNELRTLIICKTTAYWYQEKEVEIGYLIDHGDLKNLEILSFSSASSYDDFPRQIGRLCNLRLLDFECMDFDYIPPGVLSKLVKLEELLLPKLFNNWGCKEERGERENASLSEIELLPITRLTIGTKESSFLGEKLVENLTIFHVSLGNLSMSIPGIRAVLTIRAVDARNVAVGWVTILLRKSKYLKLEMVRNLKNLIFLQAALHNVLSPKLNFLDIVSCHEMEQLIDRTAEHSTSSTCFTNLSCIHINDCRKLKHLFPMSVATELRHLQNMTIQHCAEIEKVVYKEEDDDGKQIMEKNIPKDDGKEANDDDVIVIFPKLKELFLLRSLKLRVLYDGNEAIGLPSLERLDISGCTKMEGLSYGSVNAPKLKTISINGINYQKREDLNTLVKEKKRLGERW